MVGWEVSSPTPMLWRTAREESMPAMELEKACSESYIFGLDPYEVRNVSYIGLISIPFISTFIHTAKRFLR